MRMITYMLVFSLCLNQASKAGTISVKIDVWGGRGTDLIKDVKLKKGNEFIILHPHGSVKGLYWNYKSNVFKGMSPSENHIKNLEIKVLISDLSYEFTPDIPLVDLKKSRSKTEFQYNLYSRHFLFEKAIEKAKKILKSGKVENDSLVFFTAFEELKNYGDVTQDLSSKYIDGIQKSIQNELNPPDRESIIENIILTDFESKNDIANVSRTIEILSKSSNKKNIELACQLVDHSLSHNTLPKYGHTSLRDSLVKFKMYSNLLNLCENITQRINSDEKQNHTGWYTIVVPQNGASSLLMI